MTTACRVISYYEIHEPGRAAAVQHVKGIRVVHRGEGAYPKSCDFCKNDVAAHDAFVILQDARVLHEVCAFLINEEDDDDD